MTKIKDRDLFSFDINSPATQEDVERCIKMLEAAGHIKIVGGVNDSKYGKSVAAIKCAYMPDEVKHDKVNVDDNSKQQKGFTIISLRDHELDDLRNKGQTQDKEIWEAAKSYNKSSSQDGGVWGNSTKELPTIRITRTDEGVYRLYKDDVLVEDGIQFISEEIVGKNIVSTLTIRTGKCDPLRISDNWMDDKEACLQEESSHIPSKSKDGEK